MFYYHCSQHRLCFIYVTVCILKWICLLFDELIRSVSVCVATVTTVQLDYKISQRVRFSVTACSASCFWTRILLAVCVCLSHSLCQLLAHPHQEDVVSHTHRRSHEISRRTAAWPREPKQILAFLSPQVSLYRSIYSKQRHLPPAGTASKGLFGAMLRLHNVKPESCQHVSTAMWEDPNIWVTWCVQIPYGEQSLNYSPCG